MAVRVDFIRVCNIPRPTAHAIIIRHRLLRCRVFRLLRVECITVFILCTPNRSIRGASIDLENGVQGPIDIGIDAHAEDMLVVMCVDAGINFRAPFLGVLAGIHGVGIKNTSELDLELDGAILVEDPVNAVFVVCGCEDMRDDKFSPAGDDDGIVAEIAMLEEDPSVFFVDTDGVFDYLRGAGAVDEGGVHVVDCTFAVAAEGEAVGHVSSAVFAKVEGVFAVMRVFGIAVGDDHFCEGESVEDAAFGAFVVVGDVVEDDAFAVVETDVDFPFLPVDNTAVDFEGDAIWLGYVNGFEIFSVSTFGLDSYRVVVLRGCFVNRPSNRRYIDMYNLLSVGVEDWCKVERICVLVVVDVRPIVHQGLL